MIKKMTKLMRPVTLVAVLAIIPGVAIWAAENNSSRGDQNENATGPDSLVVKNNFTKLQDKIFDLERIKFALRAYKPIVDMQTGYLVKIAPISASTTSAPNLTYQSTANTNLQQDIKKAKENIANAKNAATNSNTSPFPIAGGNSATAQGNANQPVDYSSLY